MRMIEIENQLGLRADRSGQNESGNGGDNNGIDIVAVTKLKDVGEKSSFTRSRSQNHITLCTRKGRKGGIGRKMV